MIPLFGRGHEWSIRVRTRLTTTIPYSHYMLPNASHGTRWGGQLILSLECSLHNHKTQEPCQQTALPVFLEETTTYTTVHLPKGYLMSWGDSGRMHTQNFNLTQGTHPESNLEAIISTGHLQIMSPSRSARPLGRDTRPRATFQLICEAWMIVILIYYLQSILNRGIKGDCSNAFHSWEGIFRVEEISLLIIRIEVICKRKRQSKLEPVSFQNAHK